MKTLIELHNDIEARVQAIRDDNPDWLCQMGCDGCCHRLAQIPELTPAEWALLEKGLSTLSPATRQEIRKNVAMLATQLPRFIVCPMLDNKAGTCMVYAYRPIACRTYGFYVQRDKGLYCHDIESRVEQGELNSVVWGNHDVIDRCLDKFGQKRNLVEWFDDYHEHIV